MRILSLVVLSLLFVSNLQAQERYDLGTILVTPSRYSLMEAHATSNVTVIGQDRISKSESKTVADLLKSEGGVYLSDKGTSKTQIIDIRGLGEFATQNVLVMIDGRKVNPVDISGPDWMQIPTDIVDHVELIRGSGSVLYGDNAPAGVINIITKKPDSGTHGYVSATAGSYGMNKQTVQSSYGSQKIDALVNVSRSQTDGYRNNSQIKAKDAFIKLSAKPIDQAQFNLSLNWHEDYYGLPGALLQSQLDSLGRRGTVKSSEFGETRDRAVELATILDPWQDVNIGRFEIAGSYRNRDTYGYYPTLSSDTKFNVDTYGVTGKYVLHREDMPRSLNLVAGVDYYRNNNRITGGQTSPDNLVISKDDIGAFVNGDYELVENFFLTTGTRYQKSFYTFDITNDFSGSSPSYQRSRPDVQVSKAGVKYQYANRSNIFIDYEQSFRFLATDEWYSVFSGLNQNLKQQKGDQVQGGIKHQWSDIGQSQMTAYLITTDNEIFFDPTLGGGFGLNSNYDKTIRKGIEIGQSLDMKTILKVDVLDKWETGANYTVQDPEFGEGIFKGKRIPLTPQQMLGIYTDFGFAKNWDWHWNLQYIGNRYALNDQANALDPLKPYVLVDTRLTFTFKNIEVFGGIDNIFNQKYFSFGGKGTNSTNRNYYPAPERSFSAGMKLKF